MKLKCLITAAFVMALLTPVAAIRADEAAQCQKIMTDNAAAMVTLKFVLKIKMGGRDQDREQEVTGIMMDPKGLVLCSNTQVGGFSASMRRMLGDVTVTPTDIKVLIGDDTEGVEATLLSRDSELDLAWVQIKEPGDKKYTCIDFTKSVEPKIGDHIVALRRMGKFFDRAAMISTGRIGAHVTKPRNLFVPTAMSATLGMPVFSDSGQVIGITILQMPDEDESGGARQSMQDFAGLILPASEVIKATKHARETGGKAEATATNKADKDADDKDENEKADKPKTAKPGEMPEHKNDKPKP